MENPIFYLVAFLALDAVQMALLPVGLALLAYCVWMRAQEIARQVVRGI